MPVTTSPSTVTAAQAAPVSPSSTTPPIPIPARNDGYRPLDHNSTAFGHLLDAQDGIEVNRQYHDFDFTLRIG